MSHVMPKMKILRQRLFVSHEHKDQRSMVSEYTIKSKKSRLENIIIILDRFMSNLMVTDNDGHGLPIMTTKDAQKLIQYFIETSHGEKRARYEDLSSKIRSGQIHVVWIKIPKNRAMAKNEIRTFTLTYAPQRTGSALSIRVNRQQYPLYYTLFTPDEFDFKNTRYQTIKDGTVESSGKKPEHVQKFRTYDSDVFRIMPDFGDNFEILYSFKPSSDSSMPTKIGLWTLAGLAAAVLALKHIVFWGEPPDIMLFSRHIEIGLFTIGGSLLLPQLASSRSVRSRYTKWYWIPIALGALLLI